MIRIILVDDHKIMREGLKALLEREPDIIIAGEAEDGQKAVNLACEIKPEMVIMDISMPNLNGIEATRQIKACSPAIKVLALSMHCDKQFVTKMLEAGANGFLLKDCPSDELLKAIRLIIQNQLYLSQKVANLIIKDYIHQIPRKESMQTPKLTNREKEVLQLLAEGNSTKEIASHLNLSIKTIETHRQQIMDKLNIHSIAELTKFAIREGITSLEQ